MYHTLVVYWRQSFNYIAMTQYTAADDQSIRESLASRRAEFGLCREFYQSELIYRADLDRIWRRGWLFAGHSCQIPLGNCASEFSEA